MAESTKEINPQTASPLFNRIPPELRNHIFRLVLTAYEDPRRTYNKFAYYYRPGYACARRIETALLRTCRLVYAETARLPASINELTAWYYREPPITEENEYAHVHKTIHSEAAWLRRQELRKVHIFTQQIWLEREGYFDVFLDLWEHARPTHLAITLRHTDWWWWEEGFPLALDPKQYGKASVTIHSQPSHPFRPGSWGSQFQKVKGLQVLQLELETLAGKKAELDAIIARAKGWKFTLGDGNVLILDESKTRRTGWIGAELVEGHEIFDLDQPTAEAVSDEMDSGENIDGSPSPETLALTPDHTSDSGLVDDSTSQSAAPGDAAESSAMQTSPKAPPTAKERLVAAGVVFNDAESVKGLPEHMTSTYYVVTLTWHAHCS
ncbi:MAG: hypothetical protein Q9219_001386 [cf. Caloplaca sp. 3 TL-2023]